jgi:hypothetical protein
MQTMPNPNDTVAPSRATALTAFLHGIEPRAWVFALSQCGDPERADAVFQSAVHDFIDRAQTRPLAEWPLEFWQCLLTQPLMLADIDPDLDLARLAPGPRAALLLRLIAGLDFERAAKVLDVTPAAYEAALNHALKHPDMDDAWMQELREQLHQLIHQMPADRRQSIAALREKTMAAGPEPLPLVLQSPAAPRRHLLWLWLALVVLMLALLATFWWSGKVLRAGQSEALPKELVGPPPALTDTVIVTHPDYQQLATPADDAVAQQLAFLSWIAAVVKPSPNPLPMLNTSPPPDSFDALAIGDQALLSSARAAWPTLDAPTRAALLLNVGDWQARTPAQRDQLRKRLAEWDRRPAQEKARRRTPFMAWQGLSDSDRKRLRDAAAGFAALPPADQKMLRDQFAALSIDTQRLWMMGPELGQEMVPISSLFAFVPEAERPALLQALRTLDAPARSDLALLVPRLSEAQRQALRRDLLAAPAAQRADVIRRRLAP